MIRKTGRMTGLALGVSLLAAGPGLAQTQSLPASECAAQRTRLAEHAGLSEGVRRALEARATAPPAVAQPAPAATPAGPADRRAAIQDRLEKIAGERQKLEDQRMGALVRLEFGRASSIQGQLEALDNERANLEKELGATPTGPAAQTPPPAAPATRSVADRIPCQDVAAAAAEAVRIRQRELGAREGQPGVVPLVALKGQTADRIAQELAAQFAPWPAAGGQVGLLDQDGDRRLEGFVDVPVPNVFRLYRQRGDASLGIDVFTVPGQGGDVAYAEVTRRLEEMAARQTGRTLTDLLALRPAGPVRVLGETAHFAKGLGAFLGGNFGAAAAPEGAAARSVEFQNFRGETVRALETLAPADDGVIRRRLVVMPRPNLQELWEETIVEVRPASYWQTDVKLTVARETRTTAGAPVGTRSASAPITFSLTR